jgi:hypothetical protein
MARARRARWRRAPLSLARPSRVLASDCAAPRARALFACSSRRHWRRLGSSELSVLGGRACSRPRGACLGRTSATLVNIIQHNVDEKVSGVVNTCSLHSQAAKILGQAVPSIELPKVDVVYLERRDILEGEQGDRSIEWKLFISRNQTGLVVRREPQARDFGKGRIQISQVFLELGLLLLCFCFTGGSDTQSRPK